MKSKENKGGSGNGKLLILSSDAGKAIVEAGSVNASTLLGTDRFARFCSDRGLSIDWERLSRLERLGVFTPIFRVRKPKKDKLKFNIPVCEDNNWFEKGWAWDTTGIPQAYEVPDHKDPLQEAYYSIFQIYYLDEILCGLTRKVDLDEYLDVNGQKNFNLQKKGEGWMELAKIKAESFRKDEHCRCVALLCQFVSNHYFPLTQTDQRMMRGRWPNYSDDWVSICDFEWNWKNEMQNWQPKTAEHQFHLTPEKLRNAYIDMALAQNSCDPLADWYQLTQFVSVSERSELKGDALRAETLRDGAHMLRLLYRDLFGEELSHPNEIIGQMRDPIPELDVRKDTRIHLKYVTNLYNLNPQPKLTLFVEGKSEVGSIQKIFELFYKNNPERYGIEIINLHGVNVFTDTKEDRFMAIFRLVDYLHSQQTSTFLILDNENYAYRLKQRAPKVQSTDSNRCYVTHPDYIHIWKKTFEFDNFLCDEIAAAFNKLAQGYAEFTEVEVRERKKRKNPGLSLENLYKQKTGYGLRKPRLNVVLVENMLLLKSRSKIKTRPIIQVLEKVIKLARSNPLPVSEELAKLNQSLIILPENLY